MFVIFYRWVCNGNIFNMVKVNTNVYGNVGYTDDNKS